jgi:predicted ATPase/DNA-binding winged helix-turn-helix (wHTH) protein
MKFGSFEVQAAARRLLVSGQPARLGARSFDLLIALVERRGRIVGKQELMDLVWPGLVVEENNLQVHVSALRKLLGAPVIATVPGRGYQFTARPDDEDTSVVSAAPPSATPHNLPTARSRFIGRTQALQTAARLLARVRLLTFTGIGGCGKTRLALQLAQAQLARYPDGVWFVDLAPLQEPQRVAHALADALEVREQPGALIERLTDKLRQRQALVVLDNCEHLIDATAELADALLRACPLLTLLATSREGLGLEGEQVFAVPPLSLDAHAGANAADAAAGECDAVSLFVDRACLAVPEFALDAHNAPEVADICRRLDGIALAIELAAARVKVLSVAEIHARLDDRFRFLTGGRRAVPRHQTLQAALQWSYESLTPPEQWLFRGLAVFVGGATLEGLLAVADDVDEHAVLETLGLLHDKSLLVVDRQGGAAPRYGMLETVRQYAHERLNAADDGAAVRDRHLRHCVELATAAMDELQGQQQSAWLARLRAEQENFLAAHAWCAQAADGASAQLRLVAGLWRYWVASGQLERGHGLARDTLARAACEADALWNCRALWALGQIAFRMGHYDETLACAERCLALADRIESTEYIAAGLILRAGGQYATGALAQALPTFQRALTLSRPLGPSVSLVGAFHGLAEVHRGLGDLAAAQGCYEESIGVARALRDARATAVPLCNLARLLVGIGALERAREVLLESLELAAAAGLQGLGEQVLDVTAGLCATVDDAVNAARFSGAALACMREAGSRRQPPDEAFVAPLVARARAALGDAAFAAAEAEGHAMGYVLATERARRWLARAQA